MYGSEHGITEFSNTINDLLKKIENGTLRQQKFHSEASYDFRTSATTIRGILEVLIRRKRELPVYEDRIAEVIKRIDSLADVADQALLLGWLHSNKITVNAEIVNLYCLLNILEDRWLNKLFEKGVSLHVDVPPNKEVITDCYLLGLTLDKLISSSISRARKWAKIQIGWNEEAGALNICDATFPATTERAKIVAAKKYPLNVQENMPSEIGNKLTMAILSKSASLLDLQVLVASPAVNDFLSTLQFSPKHFLSRS